MNRIETVDEPVRAPSSLLLGFPGTGKTDVLTTYVEANIELFVLVTESHGVDTLVDAMERRKLDMGKIHWRVISDATPGWDAMTDMATKVGTMSYEDLAKLKSGIGKKDTQQFMELLKTVQDFKSDKDGKSYGDITEWDDTRAFVVDGASGLSEMCLDLTIGFKPTAHEGEWGVAMNLLNNFIRKMTGDLDCYFTLTAHVDRHVDYITGGLKQMPALLGQKLAPKVPRRFSEVIFAKRAKDQFFWSTSEINVDLKNRALPISDSLLPSFVPIVQAHNRRKSQVKRSNQLNLATV